MDVEPDMLAHYEITDEADRLTTRARLEGERTRDLLHRFLPKAPAYVLDIGGAEGVYALPLARNGYRVHLIDPVPRHVAAAKANSDAQHDAPLAHAEVGDARDLSKIADG
ncbi:MAG TPA: class I SAM-dependent methyltransferase, partial [Mycobacterium sp.]|nr:class I SAM-dependent methyltransferase [Mycobacterium sp.]